MTKTILITGATSGIGWATAQILAKENRLILCGRRAQRLSEIKAQLSATTEVHTMCFDIRDKEVVSSKFAQLPSEWKAVDVLVNNAGNAHGRAPIHEGNIEDWDAMLDINVKGLLYVSRAVIPGMVKRKEGHIINIGSIAGREVYAAGSVYCASKFAVHALNTGMRMDLNEHDIKVSSVNPGLVDTEFSQVRFKGDAEQAAAVYKGIDPLQAEDIAEVIQFIIDRPHRVNIADVVVFPRAQAGVALLNRSE